MISIELSLLREIEVCNWMVEMLKKKHLTMTDWQTQRRCPRSWMMDGADFYGQKRAWGRDSHMMNGTHPSCRLWSSPLIHPPPCSQRELCSTKQVGCLLAEQVWGAPAVVGYSPEPLGWFGRLHSLHVVLSLALLSPSYLAPYTWLVSLNPSLLSPWGFYSDCSPGLQGPSLHCPPAILANASLFLQDSVNCLLSDLWVPCACL